MTNSILLTGTHILVRHGNDMAMKTWDDDARQHIVEAVKRHPRSREYLCLTQIPKGMDLSHFTDAEHDAYRQELIDASTDEDWIIAFSNYDEHGELIQLLRNVRQQLTKEKNHDR